MPRPFHTKIDLNTNEPADSKIITKKSSKSRSRSTSRVVENPMLSIPEIKPGTRIVRIRLVFIRIGEIDTLNEKYQAEVYYEARWTEKLNINTLTLSVQQKSQLLHERQTLRLKEYNHLTHWTPELSIENAIGQIGEQDKWFTLKRLTGDRMEPLSPPVIHLEICEHRCLKGVFWEKLELNHFPVDVQDLTVSITSHHHTATCILVPDQHHRSSINREAFFDQQEWNLYEHVATELRETKEEYFFDDMNNEQTRKNHPVLSITCRAARRPGYYYWNGFCLIFLITVCSFCIFAIPPDLPQNRLQITCTLLLTSVTFRWVVNRSLPTISYLTTLDQYAIISIVILVVLCVWHSVIAAVAFINASEGVQPLHPDNIYVYVDRYVFIIMFIFYLVIHAALTIWLYRVPYKRRREMEYLDEEYAAKKHIVLDTSRSRGDSTLNVSSAVAFHRTHSSQSMASMVRSPDRETTRPRMIATLNSFLPIEEESNKGMYGLELHEQDDVFYEHTNDEPKKPQGEVKKN